MTDDPILEALREALPHMTILEVLRYCHHGLGGVALYRRIDRHTPYVIHGLAFGSPHRVGSGQYFRERAQAEAAFVRVTAGTSFVPDWLRDPAPFCACGRTWGSCDGSRTTCGGGRASNG